MAAQCAPVRPSAGSLICTSTSGGRSRSPASLCASHIKSRGLSIVVLLPCELNVSELVGERYSPDRQARRRIDAQQPCSRQHRQAGTLSNYTVPCQIQLISLRSQLRWPQEPRQRGNAHRRRPPQTQARNRRHPARVGVVLVTELAWVVSAAERRSGSRTAEHGVQQHTARPVVVLGVVQETARSWQPRALQ